MAQGLDERIMMVIIIVATTLFSVHLLCALNFFIWHICQAHAKPPVSYLIFYRCLNIFSSRFSVALEPVLELAFVDQAGLELREIRLPLPPKRWD